MSAARALFLVLALVLACAGCSVMRPSDLPREPEWIVAVKSCRMPEGEADITHFAHHSWIDIKRGDESAWRRIEVISASSGVRRSDIGAYAARSDRRWHDRDVRVLRSVTGERARSIAERVEAEAAELDRRYEQDYAAFPGPNSNTLISDLGHAIPELSFKLHHNAVGKDYPGWFEAGWTSSRTGVRVDTLPIGFAVGLQEGVELHLLQLTFGVSLWPPRIELPFLPEIPWSDGVDAADVPEAPPADSFVGLLEEGWMSMDAGPGGLEPDGTWRIFDATEDAWIWFRHTWRAADAEHAEGSFSVEEKRYTSLGASESTRVVPIVSGHATLFDGELAGQRVVIVVERLEDGRFKPSVDVTPVKPASSP